MQSIPNREEETDWDKLLQESYDPKQPEITYISTDSESDQDDADNVDPDFRAKLDELCGPVSP